MVANKITRAIALAAGVAVSVLGVPAAAAQGTAGVSGTVTLLERDGKAPEGVAQTVIWLEGRSGRAERETVEIATENKQLIPRITIVPVGSTVTFPNHDPFNHNVFSRSESATFDLGSYRRGESRSVTFVKPGIVPIFCDVHAQMSAFVVVTETALFAQSGGDGRFRIPGVPPGTYTLHAWHERAMPFAMPIDVGADGSATVAVTLDARGYRFVQHLDKHGESYVRRGRRY